MSRWVYFGMSWPSNILWLRAREEASGGVVSQIRTSYECCLFNCWIHTLHFVRKIAERKLNKGVFIVCLDCRFCCNLHTTFMGSFFKQKERKRRRGGREKLLERKWNTRTLVQLSKKKNIVEVFSANYLYTHQKKWYRSSESHTTKGQITESNCNLGGLWAHTKMLSPLQNIQAQKKRTSFVLSFG